MPTGPRCSVVVAQFIFPLFMHAVFPLGGIASLGGVHRLAMGG
jgi:hypothetical protein